MKTCIQCKSEIDFLNDDLTLYQVDKIRYLYCDACKSPREPYTSPAQAAEMKSRIDFLESKIRKSWCGQLVTLFIGILMGWFFQSL